MNIADTLSTAASALRDNSIDFALIGGLALAAHGVVRATQDIDLLVDGKARGRATTVLSNAGFQLLFETDEVMHFAGKGQLDLLLANRTPTLEMIGRAQPFRHFPVPVVTAEDLIGLKIQAYRNNPARDLQDKADIQALIKAVPGLNFGEIKRYADLFDEWTTIEEIRRRM